MRAGGIFVGFENLWNGTDVPDMSLFISGLEVIAPMPFFVGYETVSGASGRGVDTAMEAIDLYRSLRSAGAGAIRISDETGKVYSLTDLLLLASPSPPKSPKNRPGA